VKPGFFLVLAISVLTLPTLTFSEVASPERQEHSFALGITTEYFEWHEKGVTIDGPLYGVSGTYAYHGDNQVVANASLAFSYGELQYDGCTWSGSAARANTEDSRVEFRGLAGYDWRVTGKLIMTPFVGLGYWYWNNDLKGWGGYERETTYWYCPFGIRTTRPLSHNGEWGVAAEYDLFLGGAVKSHLSDTDPGLNDPKVNLKAGAGYGVRCSIWVGTKMEESLTLRVEPFLIYWNIDKSNGTTLALNGTTVGSLFEPSNDTTSYGVRLSMEF